MLLFLLLIIFHSSPLLLPLSSFHYLYFPYSFFLCVPSAFFSPFISSITFFSYLFFFFPFHFLFSLFPSLPYPFFLSCHISSSFLRVAYSFPPSSILFPSFLLLCFYFLPLLPVLILLHVPILFPVCVSSLSLFVIPPVFSRVFLFIFFAFILCFLSFLSSLRPRSASHSSFFTLQFLYVHLVVLCQPYLRPSVLPLPPFTQVHFLHHTLPFPDPIPLQKTENNNLDPFFFVLLLKKG